MLEVTDLTKSYGERRALDGVSLGVLRGEIVALLGPNGAGKSTLVSVIAGLLRPDAGCVRVDGIDVAARPRAARTRIGLAPQDTGLYDVLTVSENLRFFGEIAGLRNATLAGRIAELAHAFRLDALLARPARELSGGERRRLHTAIAFLNRPPLLLLDEPTVGADIETRAALLDVVRAAARNGAAVLYSTHYLPEVDALGASVTILVRGRVIASGRVDALVAEHAVPAAELTFDGPAPPCTDDGAAVTREGSVLRITASDPAAAVARVVSRLGSDTRRLRAIELLRPGLDSAFLSLTGRRYDAEELHDVVAS